MAAKRKISIRKILQVFTTLVVSAGCIVAIAGASKMDDKTLLKGVEVHIRNDKKYHFIEQKEILDLAINNRNIDISHTPLSGLDIGSMERVIMEDPWVAAAQVYIDNVHVLHIYVTQRIPVARLFQKNNVSYYMDSTMSIMPLSASNVYYTEVVTNLPPIGVDSASWSLRRQVVSLARTIEADSFWNSQISEVIVDSAGMFEMIPVLGNHRILFGDATRMHEKFTNLFVFYRDVLNRIGWDKYETLDVRFRGQVVASPSLPYKGPVDKAVVNMNWINSILESEAKRDELDSMHAGGTKESAAAPAKVTPKSPAPVVKKDAGHARKAANASKKDTKKDKAKKQKGKGTDKDKKSGGDKNHKPDNKKQSSPKYVYPDKKDH